MKLSVRNLVLSAVVMATAVVSASPAFAAAKFNVPFNFTVNGKTLPAGKYTVDKELNSSIVTLQSKDTAQTFRWVLTPGDASPNSSKATLSFDEVGQSHTLKSVQYGPMGANVDGAKRKHNSDVRTRIIEGQ